MTELPRLRAMIGDTAQRRYPRRRTRQLIPMAVAATVVAAAVAALVVRAPEREIEAVATPAPSVATSTATPLPTTSNTAVKPVDVADLRDKPAVRDDLASGGELARAWEVPALEGHVHLIRMPDGWCISVPDPLTDQPEIERGKTCADSTAFAARGIWIAIGSASVSVGSAPNAPLVVVLGGYEDAGPERPRSGDSDNGSQ